MFLEIIKWAISVGTASIVLLFLGAVAWRVLFGTKTSLGLLQRWEGRRSKHEEEQTAMGVDERAATKIAERSAFNQSSDLRIIRKSQEPPDGEAWIAQEQVAGTAVTVEQLKVMGTEFTAIIRLAASLWPEIKDAINKHCDTIEQEVKRLAEEFLREQARSQLKAAKKAAQKVADET